MACGIAVLGAELDRHNVFFFAFKILFLFDKENVVLLKITQFFGIHHHMKDIVESQVFHVNGDDAFNGVRNKDIGSCLTSYGPQQERHLNVRALDGSGVVFQLLNQG